MDKKIDKGAHNKMPSETNLHARFVSSYSFACTGILRGSS